MNNSAKRSPQASRSLRRPRSFLVSCEHGGNRVPKAYAPLFVEADAVLDSHRGLDYGALEVARAFGKRLGVEPAIATVSRLVVDLNRSPNHRNVFSEYTRELSAEQRAIVMREHYWPYRNAVEARVRAAAERDVHVVHIASHSFTPVLHGEVRNCDVGFLYDPQRPGEVRFIDAWHSAMSAAAPHLVVRRNYPYRGTSDALVTYLRRRYGDDAYAGVELEVNQKYVDAPGWGDLVALLTATLAEAAAG